MRCTCFSWRSNLAWSQRVMCLKRQRMRRCCCSLLLEKLLSAVSASWLLSTGCKQTNIHNNVITWVKRNVTWVQPGADVCDSQVSGVNLKIMLPQPEACLKWSLWSLQTSFGFVAVFTASRSERAPCRTTDTCCIIWLVREALETNRIGHVQQPNLNAQKGICIYKKALSWSHIPQAGQKRQCTSHSSVGHCGFKSTPQEQWHLVEDSHYTLFGGGGQPPSCK